MATPTTPIAVNVIRGYGFPRVGLVKHEGRFYVSITIENTKKTTGISDRGNEPVWNEVLDGLDAHDTSFMNVALYAKRTSQNDEFIGGVDIASVLDLAHTEEHITCTFGSRGNSSPSLELTLKEQSGVVVAHQSQTTTSAQGIEESGDLREAHGAVHAIQNTPALLETAGTAIDNANAVYGGLVDFTDIWKPLLEKVSTFVELANGIAEVHPYAKMAWSVLSFIPKALSDQNKRDEKIKALLLIIDDAYSFVNQAAPLEDWADTVNKYQQKILADIAKQTTDCAYFIRDYAKDQNFLKRTLKNITNNADSQISEYEKKFCQLKTAFQERAILSTEIAVCRVLDSVEEIASGLKQSEINENLRDIHYVGAGFQSDKGCHPGTRKAILEEIENWINDPDDWHRVCMILGPAGTGKSSIAHEVARRFKELQRLGSSFYFDRAKQASRRPEYLFTNMARDLADCEPCFKRALGEAISDDTDLRHTTDLARQLDKLILGPAKALRLVGPLVLVIDALDESGTENARRSMLGLLASKVSELPPSFRILVTSRPEPDIIEDFRSTASHFIRMDDSNWAGETRADILSYIYAQGMVSNSRLKTFLTDERCGLLAKKSEGLFQWASVACSYLDAPSKGGLTTAIRFHRLVHQSSDTAPDGVLYTLYLEVLRQHFCMDDPDVEKAFKSVMGYILAVFEPLSISSLAQLCFSNNKQEPLESVTSVVGCMGSLLSGVHDQDASIHPLHTSFHDFLVNRDYSCEFYINPGDYHDKLASACLKVMQTDLKFNICQFETSYTFNKKVQGLIQKIHDFIPSSVSYACCFWATHLKATEFNELIYKQLHCFLFKKLLFWLEALSLLGEIGTVAVMLSNVVQWTKGQHVAEDGERMAYDAISFVRRFGGPIAQSAPHLYLSALPFSPEGSLISKHYESYFPHIPQVSTGRQKDWPQLQMTLQHTDVVNSVALSPNSHYIVSGSYDNTIHLWNAETGEAIGAPLRGHTEEVWSVAFSPDGHRIISGSEDWTVRLWNAETGEAIAAPLQGHTDPVYSVAFSPNGNHIVSGSSDMTIRLWNAETGEAIGAPFQGHTAEVHSVAFSPDGNHIVSGSYDNTVHLWNAEIGEAIGTPLQGHTAEVWSVAFSPDGNRIVSGSFDNTVRLWNAETGEAIAAPLQGHTEGVRSVAFSPNSHHIVSGSDDMTVCLWNTETGEAIGAPLQGHTDSVNSVAFSPDGHYIISGSADNTIRLWNADEEQRESVIFSCNPNHALTNPETLLKSSSSHPLLSSFQSEFRDNNWCKVKLEEDGWRVGPQSQLLLWIPGDNRRQLPWHPREELVIGAGGPLQLDLSDFAHGLDWHRCYVDSGEGETLM